MKLALISLLISLASWSTGQLIYPDQFESMVAATVRPQRYQSDAAPLNSAAVNIGADRIDGLSPLPAQATPMEINTQLGPASSSQATDLISKGITRFALRMDDAVAVTRNRFVPGSRENVVFSPLSVAATLALVLLGSAGKTFEEVSTILGLNAGLDISRNSEAVHQMFGILISAIRSKPGLPESSFANGIFVRDGYPIRPEFKAASQKIYNSEVINLDYQNDGNNAQKTVNAWVNDKTHGKIPSILSGPPPAETSIIIASALYFNGEWNQYFIDGSTRRKPFNVNPGETVNVDMMYNGGEFLFFEDKQLRAKIVGLPYKGREVTMYVVLPTDEASDALRSLERRLDADTLEILIRNMRNETCIIGLPRMKLSTTLSLRDALQSLGLNSLFDPATADLSLISAGYTGDQLTGGFNSNLGTSTSQPPITDTISFPSRFAETPRPNYFSYDDKVGGYHVEQWGTGFSIGRISSQRHRRSLNTRKWRMQRNAMSEEEEKNDRLGASKYRFERRKRNALGGELQRSRRQTITQNSKDFLNEVDNQYQVSYGLDYIRNNLSRTNPRLFADDVLHRVEIDITEKGTEAAAATSVILSKDGSQKRLVANRPFLFFIRHESTGLLLFWGSVNKPTPNYAIPTRER